MEEAGVTVAGLDWEAISAVTNIFMTVATFAAVVTSLWIAIRSNRARVNLAFSSHDALFSYPLGKKVEEFVSVTVSNRSCRSLKVHSWFIEFRPSRQKAVVLDNVLSDAFTNLPATLEVDDSLILQFGLSDFYEAVVDAINKGLQSPKKKVVFLVKYGPGKIKRVKTDYSAAEMLRLIDEDIRGSVLD